MNIDIMNKDMVYPVDRKYDLICFHAAQAVEKFLKGYIIQKGQQAEKTHNLEILLAEAISIDASFKVMSAECAFLKSNMPITTQSQPYYKICHNGGY
jgi:HEPN domain-containing protein